LGLWPRSAAFDPFDDTASSVLDELVDGPAAALTAVALVSGPAARASGWAARAAAAIAAGWRGPRRVVLLDLDVGAPSLHEHAGVANDEGVADIVEYGASLASVRRTAAGGVHDVVATGLYFADPDAVLRSEAWDRVLVEAAAERCTLLFYVPAEAEGMHELVRRTGAVLVLAGEDEAQAIVETLPSPYAVLAVLMPRSAAAGARAADGADAAEPLATAAAADEVLSQAVPAGEPLQTPSAAPEEPLVIAAGAAELLAEEPDGAAVQTGEGAASRLTDEEYERIRLPTDREAREALIADLRERQREARLVPPIDAELAAGGRDASIPAQSAPVVLLPDSGSERARDLRVETTGDEVSLDTLDPGQPAEPQPRNRYRTPLLWTIFIVLGGSLLAGAWHFLAGRLGTGDAVGPVPVEDVAPQPAPPPPAHAEVPLPYVVAMEAHVDVATAFRRIDALEQESDLAFHISPLEREGTLYYHVMAGPAPDSATALAVRDSLLARRLKTSATPTDIRYAPLSFHVGDYSTPDAAQEAMSELRTRENMPSFVLMAQAADGEPLYRVFVGAFTTAAEADVTRQLLRAAGVADSLVSRTGSITQ
jgi:hypothetical protein